MKNFLTFGAMALLASSAHGEMIQVQITGQVAWNGISDPPLSNVSGSDAAVMSFMVDSDVYIDGLPGDLRSYEIIHSSFSLTFGGDVAEVSLLDPFPAGQTPYFTIVEGFPVSDGFFVSTSLTSPGGVPVSQEPYQAGFNVGYTGDTLTSLDILDALGTYGFDGLTNFGFGLWAVFPDNVVLGIDFTEMTISTVSVGCPADLNGDNMVDAADLAALLGAWGANPGHPADLNGDDMVNAADLAVLLGEWGPCS